MPTANEAIGRRFSWDEIVGMFPDRWVALTDYVLDGADVESGVLQAVCADDKVSENDAPLRKKGLKKIFWLRTTDLPGGALWID